MPALYPEAFQRLKTMLDALDPISHTLGGQSPGFITDMVKKAEQYGERMFCSPRQLQWVESLYEKHIGQLPGNSGPAQSYGASAEERRDLLGDDADGLDDEIPF